MCVPMSFPSMRKITSLRAGSIDFNILAKLDGSRGRGKRSNGIFKSLQFCINIILYMHKCCVGCSRSHSAAVLLCNRSSKKDDNLAKKMSFCDLATGRRLAYYCTNAAPSLSATHPSTAKFLRRASATHPTFIKTAIAVLIIVDLIVVIAVGCFLTVHHSIYKNNHAIFHLCKYDSQWRSSSNDTRTSGSQQPKRNNNDWISVSPSARTRQSCATYMQY